MFSKSITCLGGPGIIPITHGMGGLVARAVCKLEGMEGKIAGVFHSVMPTDGAAAAYKRMLSGFGGDVSWLTAKVLGPRGEFISPVFAMNDEQYYGLAA